MPTAVATIVVLPCCQAPDDGSAEGIRGAPRRNEPSVQRRGEAGLAVTKGAGFAPGCPSDVRHESRHNHPLLICPVEKFR